MVAWAWPWGHAASARGSQEMKTIFKLLAVAPSLLAAPAAFAGLVVSAPVDVIGNLSLSQFTTLGYGTNTYKDWGNEPSVTVNPTNPNDVFISSFAYNTSSTSSGANVFYSTTSGASWTAQFSVPAPTNGVTIPNDWRFQYNSAGVTWRDTWRRQHFSRSHREPHITCCVELHRGRDADQHDRVSRERRSAVDCLAGQQCLCRL
jgi:hypothetical protein